MRIRREMVYGAPRVTVLAMLSDVDFRRRAATDQDAVSAEVVLTPRADGFTLVVDRQQSMADLPSFARAMVGPTTRVVQREDWADEHGAGLEIDMPGKPVTTSGSITLRPEGAGTRAVVEVEVTVRVPFVGGRLERLIGGRIAAGIEAEHALGVRHLEENP